MLLRLTTDCYTIQSMIHFISTALMSAFMDPRNVSDVPVSVSINRNFHYSYWAEECLL